MPGAVDEASRVGIAHLPIFEQGWDERDQPVGETRRGLLVN
jgi:hypothetical protein